MLNYFSWYHPPKKKNHPPLSSYPISSSLSLSHPPTTETPRIALAFGAPRGWHSTMCDHRANREERNREKCRPCLEQNTRNPSDLGTWLGLLETSGTAATNMTSIFWGGWRTKRNRGKLMALFFHGSCLCSCALFFSFIPTEFRTLICWYLARIILFLGNQLWLFNDELYLEVDPSIVHWILPPFHSEPNLAVDRCLYSCTFSKKSVGKKQDTSERESCFPQTSANYVYYIYSYYVYID